MDQQLHNKLYALWDNSFAEEIEVDVTEEEFNKLKEHATFIDNKRIAEEHIDKQSHFAKKTTPYHGFIHKRTLPMLIDEKIFTFMGTKFKITVV